MLAQLKKGILELCILKILLRGETYGYPLIQEMKLLFEDTDESTFYSILRRIKAEGLADSYEKPSSEGPVRKYYVITPLGKEKLNQMCKEWGRMKDIVDSI